MKSAYEHVEINQGCSIRIYHRTLQKIPFEWHHHPEYELTLTINSNGKRYVGDSIADYSDNDLVLVPPDLPHTWSSSRTLPHTLPQEAIVIWFDGEWVRRLASCCPEYTPLLRLLHRAGCGLSFHEKSGLWVRERLEHLLSRSPIERLRVVLDILCTLAEDAALPLASPSAFKTKDQGNPSGHQPEHINRILATIDTRFSEHLSLAELAAAGNLSIRSLNRYFHRHIGESAGQYLIRVRIGHACRLLSETGLPVAMVAARSGFQSIPNFNRHFRALKSKSPSAWRNEFSKKTGLVVYDDAVPLDQRPSTLDTLSKERHVNKKTKKR